MELKLIGFNFLICLANVSYFSQIPVSPNFQFITFLIESNKNREALFLLDQPNELKDADTVNYLKGLNYYLLKKTDSAALYLNVVSPNGSFYTKSRFLAALNLSYSKKYTESLASFREFNADTIQKYNELINLLTAGNYLLLRDHKRFDSVAAGFHYNDYRCEIEQGRMTVLESEARHSKKKSPLVAGLLSAIIPGSGKFYAGKRGAAMSALSANAVLAAITLETYYRDGHNTLSPPFIIFATLTAFFYTGNIVGSVYSVKQQIKSINGRINNETLANMHASVVRFVK